MGSSPISNAVEEGPASAYPRVFALYPRLSTENVQRSSRWRISHSTMGDLPVPPVARLPTQIRGRLKEVEDRIFLSKHQLRILTTPAYRRDMGKRRIRIGFNKGKLTFMGQMIYRRAPGPPGDRFFCKE